METNLELATRLSKTPAFEALVYAHKHNYTLAGNGAQFRRDKQGVLPELMQKYYDDRKKYKKLMLGQQAILAKDPNNVEAKRLETQYNNLQMAKKISLNSAYGALSNQYFRFYNDDLAEAITLSGQVSIRWAERKMNKYMNKLLGATGKDFVIASDTDSLYVSMEDLVARFMKDKNTTEKVALLDKIAEEKLQPFIDGFYQELCEHVNGYEQKMQMKREAIAERGIWTGAKRYIMLVWNNEGVQYTEPKFKMVGIEAVRSSTATICRDIIKKGARIIIDLDQDKLYKFIEESKIKFFDAPLNDIARNSSIKDIHKYRLGDKSVPSHVCGSLAYNDLILRKGLSDKYPLIKDGDRVKFVRLKVPNPTHQIWVSFPNAHLPQELNLEQFINHEELASIGFLTPLTTIASAAGMNLEHVATLESFFS